MNRLEEENKRLQKRVEEANILINETWFLLRNIWSLVEQNRTNCGTCYTIKEYLSEIPLIEEAKK